ncbi:ABC-type transporter ATP-binding protein EcsA [Asticcacaulis sp. MM231]|uniref:ABC transporter ATP-binding protein n=1 Tax=Asticcacaulis sp. MM231 TaxID=3157666 RepID=UPI0032D574EB
MIPLLEVLNLKVDILKRPILKGITFTAMAGWYGILGINGSGKTTLLKALCARQALSGGCIKFNSADLTGDEAQRARLFSFAPAVNSLPQNLKARELIELLADLKQVEPFEPHGVYKALGLEALKDTLIGSMSAGMRQRVSLYCAFLGTPDVIMLDEPFNWLDPVAVYDLKRELRTYADLSKCVITTLHEVSIFASQCDSGMLMHDGKPVRLFDEGHMPTKRSEMDEMETEIYQLFPR